MKITIINRDELRRLLSKVKRIVKRKVIIE